MSIKVEKRNKLKLVQKLDIEINKYKNKMLSRANKEKKLNKYNPLNPQLIELQNLQTVISQQILSTNEIINILNSELMIFNNIKNNLITAYHKTTDR